jgi:N-acetyl-anhydromuramyl-L-alanine amidase AmpD
MQIIANLITTDNYYPIEFSKHQIVIGHSFNSQMNHVNGWLLRNGRKNKSAAAFSVDRDGKVYQHYNSKYFSDFIGIDGVNQHLIPIVLVNDGWLIKEPAVGGFYNLNGNRYDGEVIERKWRNYQYWAAYSDKQFKSLVELVMDLCKNHDIYKKCIGHNTKVDNIKDFEGIAFKSNYSKDYTDLSPAFDYDNFKLTIENNE